MAAPHPTPHSDDLSAAKAALRARARAIRKTLDPAAGHAVARHVLATQPLPPGAALAGFWPMGDEIDLRPLWHALHGRGYTLLLPQTPPLGQALMFRAWSPGMEMVAERFGTQRPTGEVCRPALIFVPFLAFDAACHRLGYGGGYYDRTLAALAGVPAIGLGFSALAVDRLPVGPHDRRLDAVITELGVNQPRDD